MKADAGGRVAACVRRAAMAIGASGIVAASTVLANPTNNIVLVPPANLPVLTRQSGEAMLLRNTIDGRTVLYVEQNQGIQLAIFDVTDPAHIKSEGAVQLDASGPFDFAAPVGNDAEFIRFRQGDEDAILDLQHEKTPRLKAVHGLTLHGPVTHLGNEGFAVRSETPGMQQAPNYQVVDTTNLQEPIGVLDVNRVRAEATNASTGTTFLLTDNGLYLIRRPSVEFIHQLMLISPN
jgi:hypothetical protein